MILEVTLCGEGVVPAVTVSHPGGPLDFGYVLEKESASHVLKVSQQCVKQRNRIMCCWFQIESVRKITGAECEFVDGGYALITASVLPAAAEQFSGVGRF